MPTKPTDVAESLLATIKYLADEAVTIKPTSSPDGIRAAADSVRALSEAYINLGFAAAPKR
jgi:hypothetical protein